MTDTELKLLKSFPGSFINDHGEFIPEKSGVTCFSLYDCKSDLEIKYKVLEWCSRAAFKSEPYQTEVRNNRLHEFILNGINAFLDTDFSTEDMELIYTKLGNNCNRPLCEKFVESGYDMEVLR